MAVITDSRISVAFMGVIDPLNPDPDKITIETIAHALSRQCRFTGHITQFYSVAEHCVRVSYVVPPKYQFVGLMHDASEAYLLDVPSPLKHALFGERYREVEEKLMTVISQKFGFEWPMPLAVAEADNSLLRTEVRDLMPRDFTDLTDEEFEDLWEQWFFAPPQNERITKPWHPEMACETFLKRYHYLKGLHE